MDAPFSASGRGAVEYDDVVALRVLGVEVFGHHIALAMLLMVPVTIVLILAYVMFVLLSAADEDEDMAPENLPVLPSAEKATPVFKYTDAEDSESLVVHQA